MLKFFFDVFFLYEGVQIVNFDFGCYCEVGVDVCVLNFSFGDYSYCEWLFDIVNMIIGKFVNIVVMMWIGLMDYLMIMVSLYYFLYCLDDYFDDVVFDVDFFVVWVVWCMVIGYDIWIGYGVIIKFEVSVGYGVIVVVGVVVIKDVFDWMIVVGCLVKLLCECFLVEIGVWLMVLLWWDWDYVCLCCVLFDFCVLYVVQFLCCYES